MVSVSETKRTRIGKCTLSFARESPLLCSLTVVSALKSACSRMSRNLFPISKDFAADMRTHSVKTFRNFAPSENEDLNNAFDQLENTVRRTRAIVDAAALVGIEQLNVDNRLACDDIGKGLTVTRSIERDTEGLLVNTARINRSIESETMMKYSPFDHRSRDHPQLAVFSYFSGETKNIHDLSVQLQVALVGPMSEWLSNCPTASGGSLLRVLMS